MVKVFPIHFTFTICRNLISQKFSYSFISSFDFKAPIGASDLPLSQQTNRRTSASQMVISRSRKDGATDDFWADMLKFLVHDFFLFS